MISLRYLVYVSSFIHLPMNVYRRIRSQHCLSTVLPGLLCIYVIVALGGALMKGQRCFNLTYSNRYVRTEHGHTVCTGTIPTYQIYVQYNSYCQKRKTTPSINPSASPDFWIKFTFQGMRLDRLMVFPQHTHYLAHTLHTALYGTVCHWYKKN